MLRNKSDVMWDVKDEAHWEDLGVSLTFTVAKSVLESCRMTVYIYDKDRIKRKRYLGGVNNIKLRGVDVNPITSWYTVDSSLLTDDSNNTITQPNISEVLLHIHTEAVSVSNVPKKLYVQEYELHDI